MTDEHSINQQIVSLIEKNDLLQLQVVLDKTSSKTIDWDGIMMCAARMNSIQSVQLVARKTQEILGSAYFVLKTALPYAQSAAIAHFLLDEIQKSAPEIPSDTGNWNMRLMVTNCVVDALMVMAERVDLTQFSLHEGMFAAIETQRIEKVDVFVPFMDEEDLVHALIYAGMSGHQHMVDHLYTLDRAGHALQWCDQKKRVSRYSHGGGIDVSATKNDRRHLQARH